LDQEFSGRKRPIPSRVCSNLSLLRSFPLPLR
jgi:hypothetical protein